MAAERQYNLAIRKVSAAMPQLNKEHCHAVYTAAAYIFICSFMKGPRPCFRTVLEICSKVFSPGAVLGNTERGSDSSSQREEGAWAPVRIQPTSFEYGYWLDQLRHFLGCELEADYARYPIYCTATERIWPSYEAIYSSYPPTMTADLSWN
ncbi:uncharacterized protein BDW43DRAFT_305314 [Aspergillus alliaceus]|uniref:uncharacterized protein n=1 Tax=Petromyces alliaceus TaxID=209559 RepID=UPI0012A46ECD|nr:uncharacterized protein BDW43DRAFT_305314 [Aspergillus alliaceus]KAB8239537.1 hypothetical protein BDW43DRAFT_305314 [Aspergillus alliaceus]